LESVLFVECHFKTQLCRHFILIAATLYIYATSLKQMLLLGNIVVALLLSFSVIIIGIFDLYPVIDQANQPIMANLFDPSDFALFAL
jgi:4-hydroxybenzoate polyprenyltransferase